MDARSAPVDRLAAATPAAAGGWRRRGALPALAVALALGAAQAWAQGDEVAEMADATVASAAPGADAADFQSPSALARWVTSADFAGGTYRWSMSRGAVAIGFGFDTPARANSVASTRLDNAGPLVQTLPSLSVGLRSVDLPGGSWLKQLAGGETATGLTRHIGIEWKPAETQVMFVREGLGVRLSGDDSVTMRLKKGTLSIYMKRNF
jgi:hypothetical protein